MNQLAPAAEQTYLFFASTAYGLEELLKTEIDRLIAQQGQVALGGIYFSANLAQFYQVALWSRLASRVFVILTAEEVRSDADIYQLASVVDWPALFSVEHTFVVDFTGTNEFIRNSQYGALRVKDAIVDRFSQSVDKRPVVAKEAPDIRVRAWLRKNQLTLALDLTGPLHQRGYRLQTGEAPLKENLAAAIVTRSGWQTLQPLIDPMCGSGTLLIEAALMACDAAPGRLRQQWGFLAWRAHQPILWQTTLAQADSRFQQGKQQLNHRFYGYDSDRQVVGLAKQNAQRAGVASYIDFAVQDISQLTLPDSALASGVIITNPPYGERLATPPALVALYAALARVTKQHFTGWQLSVFTASPHLLDAMGLRAKRQFTAKNGQLDCVQKNYPLQNKENSTELSVVPSSPAIIATDFANRLQKNAKKLAKWAKQQGVDCYRVYDADLPDYNAAIDRYLDWLVIYEYAAPKNIDATKARQRLLDVIQLAPQLLSVPVNQVVVKVREKQKGQQQYQALAKQNQALLVNEYQAKFWVNLTDYLDTGLFLDHRLTRKYLATLCRGKDFLNLFAYTGSATVYAGLGGARSTTTVDMSNTYLQWAERNLRTNGLQGKQHQLIQADCLMWLANTEQQFDVIFVDPPTFSNSKRMQVSFDVQRDHIVLLRELKRLLRPAGSIIFSNNKRGFVMDSQALQQYGLAAENITDQMRSIDFARNKQINNCWLVKHH